MKNISKRALAEARKSGLEDALKIWQRYDGTIHFVTTIMEHIAACEQTIKLEEN